MSRNNLQDIATKLAEKYYPSDDVMGGVIIPFCQKSFEAGFLLAAGVERWIPVEERLPEVDAEVEICDRWNAIGYAKLDNRNQWIVNINGTECIVFQITHWKYKSLPPGSFSRYEALLTDNTKQP